MPGRARKSCARECTLREFRSAHHHLCAEAGEGFRRPVVEWQRAVMAPVGYLDGAAEAGTRMSPWTLDFEWPNAPDFCRTNRRSGGFSALRIPVSDRWPGANPRRMRLFQSH